MKSERPGNRHALPLAAAEGVRVAKQKVPRRQRHPLQQLAHLPQPRHRRADAVDDQRLFDDFLHAAPGIQRRGRILKHHLHLPAHRPQRLFIEACNVASFEDDLSIRRRQQPSQQSAERGLARSGLAHQGQGRAFLDCQAHTVDGFHIADSPAQQPCGDREILDQPARVQQSHRRVEAG